MVTESTLALAGQVLGSSKSYHPGIGTHLWASNVCASLTGLISISNSSTKPAGGIAQPTNVLPTISVSSHNPGWSAVPAAAASLLPTQTVLPAVNSTVLAKVTRINPRQATVEILVVGDNVCVEGWQGLIRVQDIRATEKDKVKVVESFRPGDVVRAVVISLGDQSNYYLSTATNSLGVIMATSESGNPMYPISWKEFEDPVTGKKEPRKVAKPF